MSVPDWSKYEGKGFMGLVNLGNTCFMNTCLQVLNHVYELNDIFYTKKLHLKYAESASQEKQRDIQFVKEWVELQDVLWQNNHAVVSPNKFVQYVQYLARIKDREIFTGWAQNDMPEFLLFMIDAMHNSICRGMHMKISGSQKTRKDKIAIECYKMLQTVYEKEYSEVMDLFYAIYVSTISPIHDPKTIYSQKSEMFFILDLPLPPRTNDMTTPIQLYDCLNLFTLPEIMEGDNAWFNETTNQKESVVKQIRFWNLPKILVITLKRFTNFGRSKRQDLVKFPLEELNLSSYVCGYSPEDYVYDLFGVCNHTGGVLGGHYYAYVKNISGQWITYNDTQHHIMTDASSVITPTAYCLFYRRRRSSSMIQ